MWRRLPVGFAVLLAIGIGWGARPPAPAPPSAPPVATWPAGTRVRRDLPVAEPPEAIRSDFAERLGAVASDCGLAAHIVCEEDRCVAVASVPRLDSALGWARMALRSPALVASVVAGDLGLPDRALPCRGAIRDLERATTLAISHGPGELWCVVDDPAQSAALCDRAVAEALDGDAPSFERGPERIVELRPPE